MGFVVAVRRLEAGRRQARPEDEVWPAGRSRAVVPPVVRSVRLQRNDTHSWVDRQ